jgi:hypothetical protein
MYDLVIRGATVVDHLNHDPRLNRFLPARSAALASAAK